MLRLGPDALRASRFALSPLAETLSRLITLHQAADSGLRAWLAADPFAAGLLRLVSATKYLPDFVTIPPSSMSTRIDDELAEMRAVPDAAARETLSHAWQHAWMPNRTDWATGAGIAGRAAEVFARGWAQFVAPDWPRRRAIMERDIRHRAGVLAVSGWRHAIDGLGKIRWAGPDAIQFSTQSHPDRTIGGTGLVLVPHTGGTGQWTCEAGDRLALVYPARGVLAPVAEPGGGIARLIGEGRARILYELRDPATSSQLAVLLSVSLGTVSGHLAALREAGMVVGRRSGREVYYELTERGAALAGGA